MLQLYTFYFEILISSIFLRYLYFFLRKGEGENIVEGWPLEGMVCGKEPCRGWGGLGKGWVLEGQGLGRRMGRTGEAEGRSIGFW